MLNSNYSIRLCRFSSYFLLLFLGVCPFLWAFSAEYDQRVSHNEQLLTQSHVYIKDGWVRSELDLEMFQMVTIKNKEGHFTYYPNKKIALVTPAETLPTFSREIPHYRTYLEINNAVPEGKGAIDGTMCTIYEFDEPKTGGLARVWLWEEMNFPLRAEIVGDEGVLTIEFKNVQLDLALPDEVFEIPAETKIVDATAFMEGSFNTDPQQMQESTTEDI